ncbi:hypothetical protein PM082_002345 [Marasmius tenuissimus]|nr:hypothetical protein PM082_002345 [Marasmius tenuissimus]
MGVIGLSDLDHLGYLYFANLDIDERNMIVAAVFNGLLSLLTGTSHNTRGKRADQTSVFLSGKNLVDQSRGATTHGTISPCKGLAPTLLIVRVAHGKSVDSVQQVMDSIHFAPQTTHQGTGRAASTTVDIRPHIESDDIESREQTGLGMPEEKEHEMAQII